MYYFIANPGAASGGAGSVWPRIREILVSRSIPHRLCETDHKGHAAEYARQITDSDPTPFIVLIGGDGSIHETLSGLSHLEGVTFGLIPQGSGNDFARGMRLKRDPLEALKTFLEPASFKDLDVPYIIRNGQHHRFGVSAGIGFDAAVCHGVNDSELKTRLNRLHLGRFSYTAVSAQQIAFYKPGTVRIRINGGQILRFDKTYFAAVMNQPYEGGGYMMTPDALPDDGYLDIFVCSAIPKAGLLAALPLAAYGLHTSIPGLHFLRCKSAEILCESEQPVHLDGESCGIYKTLQCAIEKEKLRVVTG